MYILRLFLFDGLEYEEYIWKERQLTDLKQIFIQKDHFSVFFFFVLKVKNEQKYFIMYN